MRATVKQGDSIDLLARVTNDDDTFPALADVASVNVTAINTTTGQTTYTASLTVADVLTAGPVNDDRWREDNDGYNVAVPIGPDAMPTPANYRVTVSITMSNAVVTPLTWDVQARP